MAIFLKYQSKDIENRLTKCMPEIVNQENRVNLKNGMME
jgi:hypothetical protein